MGQVGKVKYSLIRKVSEVNGVDCDSQGDKLATKNVDRPTAWGKAGGNINGVGRPIDGPEVGTASASSSQVLPETSTARVGGLCNIAARLLVQTKTFLTRRIFACRQC